MSVQDLVTKLREGGIAAEEARLLVDHTSPVVRVNALAALIPHAKCEERYLDALKEAALKPHNRSPLMGTISVSHAAVASLLRVGTEKGNQIALELIESWPEPDRGDLLWFLRSEALIA